MLRVWHGFSFVELVLVIAMLGILGLSVSLAVPSCDRTRLDSAAKQVVSDIEYARQNAMMTGQTTGVSFTRGGSYTVYSGTIATPLTSPLTKQNMIITLATNYSGVSLSNSYVVEFNALGAPTTGGGGSITLTNGTTTRVITVTANTGKITLS